MKITFGNNIDNKSKKKFDLLQPFQIRKIPKLTDEQVKQINETRKLPEGYHSIYNLDGYGRGSFNTKYEMTITQGLPKLHPLQKAFYFDALQDGYELENYKGKTYLKEKGTTVKEIKNNNRNAAYCFIGLIGLGVLFSKILSKK